MKKAIWAKTCLALIVGVVSIGVLLRVTVSQATDSNIKESLIPVYALLLSSSSSAAEEAPFKGYNLFTSLNSTTAFLMDNDGNFVHSWETEYSPGNAMYFLEDGRLLHTGKIGNTTFTAGGDGGLVQIFDWDGNRTWQYQYSSTDHLQHHDVEILPNGNILMISWQYKDETEAIAAGRNPSLLTESELWPDSVIEVQPTGTNSGQIVWEWHVWDHLIQDYDSSKSNYGTVAEHPELINLNYTLNGGADWNHTNSIDYNPELDQIILSIHNFSEIWIIDHSTSTAEAAGHIGGNSGKGGDLLYRWGNPLAYDSGTASDQKLFVQHDAEWIEKGVPGAGNILIFNNGGGRSDGNYSSIEEIVPPVDNSGSYTLSPGLAFGPTESLWTYTAEEPTDFYAKNISGQQRLPNGNTLICDGPNGYFFEVSSTGKMVWDYSYTGHVFRVERYAPSYEGFNGTPLDDSSTLPTADTGGPYSGTMGSSITLDASNSLDSDGSISSYKWDLDNDGLFDDASGVTATYLASSVGTFTISLQVTDNTNLVDTESTTVTISGITPLISYPIVDTGQSTCYDNSQIISPPTPGAAFYGQDGQIDGYQPNYTIGGDGLTVFDNVTGLTWTKTPDLNGDGIIDVDDKLTYTQSQTYPETLNASNYGGYNDWRLPTMKELYSLMNFSGRDPNPMESDTSNLQPFIDTGSFDFGYGDTSAGERIIDAQFWSNNAYTSTVFDGQQCAFGLNLADGRIKCYPSSNGKMTKLNYVYFVRGNTEYGNNNFTNNGDGTITDSATGLMWTTHDSGSGMSWQDGLAWVQEQNSLNYLGYSDWRLPNAKELHSIFDYSRAPASTGSAAIDPIFNITTITNEESEADYPWFWTSTTHVREGGTGAAAVYLCFGRAMGYMSTWMDVHGAGAQRSDRKDGDFSGYTYVTDGYYLAISPQGDAVRIYNYIRLVRSDAK